MIFAKQYYLLLAHFATLSNRLPNAPEHFSVPGELPSKFTASEKPYRWNWLCDANFKMY